MIYLFFTINIKGKIVPDMSRSDRALFEFAKSLCAHTHMCAYIYAVKGSDFSATVMPSSVLNGITQDRK